MLLYLATLAATLVLETGIVWLVVLRRADRAHVLRTALFLNLCTHPLATLAAWQGTPFPALEVAVLGAEALGYRGVAGLTWLRSLACALLANLASGTVAVLASAG